MSKIELPDNPNLLTVITDPFSFKNITALRLNSSSWTGKWTFTATVEFKNGSTGGSQSFSGDNMDDVYLEMRAFVKQLSEKNNEQQ
jgi:hypothetical protein